MPKEPPTREELLAKLAAKNDSVATVQQLRDIGYSKQAIATAVAKGVWKRVQHGVYLLSAGKPTWRQQVRAALLAAGDEAQLHGRALAAWANVDGAVEGPIEIAVKYGTRPKPAGVTVHRTRHLSKRRMYGDVPGTSVERMLVDYTAKVGVELAERAVEHVLTRGLTAERRIWREIAELGDAVPGVVRLARIMLARPDGKAARSTLELELFRIVKRYGLPLPVRNHDVWVDGEHFEIDAAYLAEMAAIEADSKRWHSTASQTAKDKRRQATLEAAGWTFERFSSADIYGRPEWVAERIRARVCGVVRPQDGELRTRAAAS
ncbi:MAG TPA: type IV toxin-antitoxin system AbiEi family antitoxin domain-containing protein [Acidimicrobiales bacterium]|nr:type IV toxin-antitoxin system AbiEi family antitoxin domain-containing protein [Acidimicrobiales bacterium]